jgi:hypothetical protein
MRVLRKTTTKELTSNAHHPLLLLHPHRLCHQARHLSLYEHSEQSTVTLHQQNDLGTRWIRNSQSESFPQRS